MFLSEHFVNEEKWISISYVPDSFGIYISFCQQLNEHNEIAKPSSQSTVKMNGAYAPPLTAPPARLLLAGNQGWTASAAPVQLFREKFRWPRLKPIKSISGASTTPFVKPLFGMPPSGKNHTAAAEMGTGNFLDYLTNEKFVSLPSRSRTKNTPLSSAARPSCSATSPLPLLPLDFAEQAQEEIFRYYFLHQPQRDRCVLWSNTQHSGAAYQLALQRLQE